MSPRGLGIFVIFSLAFSPRAACGMQLTPRPWRWVSAVWRARLFARPWKGGNGANSWPAPRGAGALGAMVRGGAGEGGTRRTCALYSAALALAFLPKGAWNPPIPAGQRESGRLPCSRGGGGRPSPCPAPVTGVGVRMEEAGGGGGRREAGGGGGGRGPPCLWLVSSRWRQASMCESRLA